MDQMDVDRDRDVDEPGHHHVSGHEIHEADTKRTARMGWLAVGAMMLVTLLVLVCLQFYKLTRGWKSRLATT
jgi:hypothetical protein